MARVLVVDDVERDLSALVSLLEREGHHAVGCSGGQAALERIESDAAGFDAVIVDIFMPEVDGLETIKALRRRCYDGTILAISNGGSLARLDVLKIARLLGADGSARKPLGESSFTALNELLAARGTPSEPRRSAGSSC